MEERKKKRRGRPVTRAGQSRPGRQTRRVDGRELRGVFGSCRGSGSSGSPSQGKPALRISAAVEVNWASRRGRHAEGAGTELPRRAPESKTVFYE